MTLDEKIIILNAAKEKKKIRKRPLEHKPWHWSNDKLWVTCEIERETWDFSFWHYELAPEPHEIWVNKDSEGDLGSFVYGSRPGGGRWILFREVIE